MKVSEKTILSALLTKPCATSKMPIAMFQMTMIMAKAVLKIQLKRTTTLMSIILFIPLRSSMETFRSAWAV